MVTGFPMGEVNDPSLLEALRDSLTTVSEVREVHELLAKLETNHPALLSEGLRLTRVPGDVSVWGSLDWRLNSYPEMRPDWMSPAYALVAHDADPLKFGTPLIVYRASGRNGDEVGWAVQLSGMQKDAMFAAWDDREGVQALVDMALSHDSEFGSALASLSGDTETVHQQAMEAERKRLAAMAREVWSRPKDRIRPRVCQGVLTTAWQSLVERERAATPERLDCFEWVRGFASTLSVSEQSVYGWQHGASRTPLNVAARLRVKVEYVLPWQKRQRMTSEEIESTHRAREEEARECFTPSVLDRLAVMLVVDTRDARLGEVVRVASPEAGVLAEFLVTKRPLNIPRYAPAFDFPEGVRFEVARLSEDNVLAWEPLAAGE